MPDCARLLRTVSVTAAESALKHRIPRTTRRILSDEGAAAGADVGPATAEAAGTTSAPPPNAAPNAEQSPPPTPPPRPAEILHRTKAQLRPRMGRRFTPAKRRSHCLATALGR